MAWAAKGGVRRAKSPENPEEIKILNEMKDGGRGWLVRSECELAGRNKAGDEGLLDTPTTLRGGVNECGALFPKTALLHKNSSISIQHLFITHCCHL
jgi:hypothetical protein